jgi:hypothetical protein
LGDIDMIPPASGQPDLKVAREDILRTLSELEHNSPNEASRMKAALVRAELSSPESIAATKDLSNWEKRRSAWWYRKPSPRYHVHIMWPWLTIIPCVAFAIAAATNVWWVLTGELPIASIKYGSIFAGVAAGFHFLTTRRRFSLICSTNEISSKSMGAKYAHLRTGTMPTTSLQDIKERRGDKVLEIHDKSGLVMEVPMQVDGYDQMYNLLCNLASVYQQR